MLDTYAHLLTTGSTHERYNNWLNLPRLGQVSSLVLDITAGGLHQNRLTEDLFEHVKGSMFAYTESGHFGLVPPSTRYGDYLCILLGFTHPICLRSTTNGGHYEVVGGCSYIHGLMDAEALLGLQVGRWSFEGQFNTRGISTAGYLNTDTQDWVPADYDPRLGPRPDDWEVVPMSSWSQHDAMKYEEWRNKTTGEVISSDPRLTPEALKERGVHLETFSII
ncbi:uncharacterized protein PAC_19803 [Phialocephala subalpina]|uniref:Uncharacterized protein n=1 Tax=Phialocephala subalpina TaxID=576137 RepID=A0A1L7XXV5_9HELO|nr:uncharacterized protein PAC_19803 [Phialocephala subalpina]